MRYNDLQNHDNPSFRLREIGAPALSNAELLAVALRLDTTEQATAVADLYREYGRINRIPRNALKAIKGVGDKYADALFAMSELGRREAMAGAVDRAAVNSPADAAAMIQYEMSALDHEELWVILLDRRNRVQKIVHLYKGSVNSSQVRVGELFKDAVSEKASAIIVAHNHPSGEPTPSPDDVAVTRAIVQAGKLLDIEVLDHVVVGAGRWVSMKERGLGFS